MMQKCFIKPSLKTVTYINVKIVEMHKCKFDVEQAGNNLVKLL